MTQLAADSLPKNVTTFDYDRAGVASGIVHFGIGNFHRAHQAVYCDDLLQTGETDWGIIGVSLRSSNVRDALKPQDFLYTMATLGSTTDYRIIGAIQDVLVAPENPQAVVDLVAAPQTQLVTSTITEKGYCLSSGEVDFEHTTLKPELASLDVPTTIYGFLASGIIRRFQTADAASKLTIMCCDNISGGGELLKNGVQRLLSKHSPDALNWSEKSISFISSMVDRVCPATDDTLREMVEHATGCRDAWPVSGEPFTQWIIEQNFAGDRPDFEKVGAVFVDDITPFEQMKLRYLNAAHTICSTLGYLTGDKFVHQSLERPNILRFTRETLHNNILPNAAIPKDADGVAYINSVIKRFQNSYLPYANLQVGTDSSQKIQHRWFPTIDQALRQNKDTSYFEFCLGAWLIFVQEALKADVLNDPKKQAFQLIDTEKIDEVMQRYLKIANAEQFAFFGDQNVLSNISRNAKIIKTQGIAAAIDEFLRTTEVS